MSGGGTAFLFYKVGEAAMLAVAPLWLIFRLEYTGRECWHAPTPHIAVLQVVAEGVENARQLIVLKEMGCDTTQGHYFAESLSYRATSAFLVADLYY